MRELGEQPRRPAREGLDRGREAGGLWAREGIDAVAQQPLVGEPLQKIGHVACDDFQRRLVLLGQPRAEVGDARFAVDRGEDDQADRVELIGAFGRENDRAAARAILVKARKAREGGAGVGADDVTRGGHAVPCSVIARSGATNWIASLSQ